VAVAAGLALPIGAEATVSCTFNAGTGALSIDLTAANPDGAVSLQRNGSNIEVFDGFVDTPGILPTSCTNGPPTVTTTSSIQMTDTAVGQDTDFNIELGAGYFEPGTGGPAEGGGIAEIEISINGGDDGAFGDEVTVLGGAGSDEWHFGALSGGASGANLNAPEDAGPDGDDISITGVESLQTFSDPVLGSMGADDHQLANGGTEFAGPFPLPAQLNAGVGNDVITAGTGDTYLGGDADDDVMTGGPGDDVLRVTSGNDTADGGGGTDTCTYFNQFGAVTADLRITTQQDTGAGGLDTMTGCENLEGGDGNDTLIGTDGPNVIDGGSSGFEAGADTLIGLGGNDHLIGFGGADALDVRDGGPDTASCGDPTPGPPFDTVTADEPGVDTIDPDCEQVFFLAVPPAPPSADTLAPETTIGAGPKRKTRKRKATIAFSSSEPGSRFECSLDGKPFAPCESPFTKKVKPRRHTFQVRATDQAGNTDPTPALIRWRVTR
jgi:Ca2+-binding RTX toxin-like protein